MGKERSWSEAGAARHAREIRATTVQYLRTSPIAREMEAGQQHQALAVHARTYGERAAGPVMLYGGLGYEPPYPANVYEGADRVLTDESECLAGGELYVAEPNMADVATAAALTLTTSDLELVDMDDLPSPTGVLVLPHPLLVRNTAGELTDLRALTWHTPARSAIPSKSNPEGVLAAVRISTYQDTYGPVQPPEFQQFLEVQRLAGRPMPPLMFDAVRCFPFRHSPDDLDAFRRQANAVREYTEMLEQATADIIPVSDESDAEYSPGEQLDDPDGLLSVKLLYAFWRLCEQRITVLDSAPINHSAKVTSERARVSPQVRIVRLRRASTPRDGAAEASTRNWNHRWIVRMHKVRQWFPSFNQHKILYRGPYIKGPDGKPILGGETVRALVR